MQACYHFISCNSSTDIKFLNFFILFFLVAFWKENWSLLTNGKRQGKSSKEKWNAFLIFLRSSFFFLVVHRSNPNFGFITDDLKFQGNFNSHFLSFVFSIIIRRRFLSDFFVKNGGKFSNYFDILIQMQKCFFFFKHA